MYLTRLQLLIKHPVRTQLIRDNITICQSVAPLGQTNVPKLIWFNPPHLNRDIDNCNFYVMFTLQTRKATLMLKSNLKGKSLSNSNICEIYTRLIAVQQTHVLQLSMDIIYWTAMLSFCFQTSGHHGGCLLGPKSHPRVEIFVPQFFIIKKFRLRAI